MNNPDLGTSGRCQVVDQRTQGEALNTGDINKPGGQYAVGLTCFNGNGKAGHFVSAGFHANGVVTGQYLQVVTHILERHVTQNDVAVDGDIHCGCVR